MTLDHIRLIELNRVLGKNSVGTNKWEGFIAFPFRCSGAKSPKIFLLAGILQGEGHCIVDSHSQVNSFVRQHPNSCVNVRFFSLGNG